MEYFFIIVLGLVFGSFLSALSYRAPLDISISRGRSFCPHCKKTIAWHDNIPVISYLLLGGKCRHCHFPISVRYPLIELATASSFFVIFLTQQKISANISWIWGLGAASFVVLLIIAALLITVFVIDSEHQIIPDNFVFALILIILGSMLITDYPSLLINLASGLFAAVFLLIIHLLTFGRGMGLGDVKFAIAGGMLVGFPLVISWLMVSFIIGGIFGIVLMIAGYAKMKTKIAFGPFLIAGLFVVMLSGGIIL